MRNCVTFFLWSNHASSDTEPSPLKCWQEEEEVCEKSFLVRGRPMVWMRLTFWSIGWPLPYYVVLDRWLYEVACWLRHECSIIMKNENEILLSCSIWKKWASVFKCCTLLLGSAFLMIGKVFEDLQKRMHHVSCYFIHLGGFIFGS